MRLIQEESNGNKNKNISKMTQVINFFKNKIINNCEDKDKIFVFDPNERFDEKQDINKYIKDRVKNRIDFFNCLMHRDKKRYENLQVAIIIIGGSIVIVNSVFDSYYPYILHPAITILGALVVILTSIASFKKISR